MSVHARIRGHAPVFQGGICRHRQHRQILVAAILADPAGRSVTVHDRHLHVHEHTVETARRQLGQRLLPVIGDLHQEACLLQKLAGYLLIDFVVLHQQDARALHRPQGLHIELLALAAATNRLDDLLTEDLHDDIE